MAEQQNENRREKDREMMGKKKKRVRTWLYIGILVSLAAAAIYTSLYGGFRLRVERMDQRSLDTDLNLRWLYQNTYVLYKELYNRENRLQADYLDLYVRDVQSLDKHTGEKLSEIFEDMEIDFSALNDAFGYIISSNRKKDCFVTNMSENELDNLSDSYFLISFVFDGDGYVSVGEAINGSGESDSAALRKTAMKAVREAMQFEPGSEVTLGAPKDCTVTYAVSRRDWENNSALLYSVDYRAYSFENGDLLYINYIYHTGFNRWSAYYQAGTVEYLLVLLAIVFGLGLLLPIGTGRPWMDKKWCALPLEVLLAVGVLLIHCAYAMLDLVILVAGGEAARDLAELLNRNISSYAVRIPVLGVNLTALTVLFLGAWYVGISLKAIKGLGLGGYLKERSLIVRFFRFIKRKLQNVYQYFIHVDLTEKSLKTIRKLVIFNALILSVISVTWLAGLGVALVYSIVLYILLKKYFSDLQRKYGVLLKAVDEMAEGNLNVVIEEDIGVFEPFKPQIIKIQSGFKKAVDEEVKSQRMKAELITNVSHDLKTPLTAIITYVNLLKDTDLTEEQRKKYLDTLEQKSMRLKVLIDDLFDVSKANSGNVNLNIMPVDIMNLVKQVSYEMKDKLNEAGLDVRMNLADEKITLSLDSQKTYRIYENLFANVAKYALPGTRVYVNGFRIDDTVVITLKNISANELTVDASELMERFVRGDESRNTEGSGLGLAIAKSFAELQGGRLELEVDGDLFKATTVWKVQVIQ